MFTHRILIRATTPRCQPRCCHPKMPPSRMPPPQDATTWGATHRDVIAPDAIAPWSQLVRLCCFTFCIFCHLSRFRAISTQNSKMGKTAAVLVGAEMGLLLGKRGWGGPCCIIRYPSLPNYSRSCSCLVFTTCPRCFEALLCIKNFR